MELRELTRADLPALLDLCRRALPLEAWTPALLQRRVFEEPGCHPPYLLCARVGSQLAGVMLATRRLLPDGPVVGVSLFAVDPAYRRQRLASLLLAMLETRLQTNGVAHLRVGQIAPNYLWPGLDLRYTPALCFLQQHGFQRVGETYTMAVDLRAQSWDTAAAEERLARAGWQIRRLHPRDRELFGLWLRETWGTGWEYEGLAAYENKPVSAFVADNAGAIGAFACYNVSAFTNAFGPTGVAPQGRGLGLGRVLLYRCLRELRELGHQQAEICWVGPFAFYAHTVGAWISRVCWFLEKALRAETIDDR